MYLRSILRILTENNKKPFLTWAFAQWRKGDETAGHKGWNIRRDELSGSVHHANPTPDFYPAVFSSTSVKTTLRRNTDNFHKKRFWTFFFLSATIKIVRVNNCLRHRRTSVFQPVRSGPIRANARTRRLGWINSGPYNRFVAGWIINLYNTYLTVFIPYLLYFSNKTLLQ